MECRRKRFRAIKEGLNSLQLLQNIEVSGREVRESVSSCAEDLEKHDEVSEVLVKSQTSADVRLFNRRTSAGKLCRSNQLFTVHLLGGDKFSYQLDSCTSKRFRFNKELNYKLASLEVFLPNRHAFTFVASLKIYCTSRRVTLGTSFWEISHCIILFTCIYQTLRPPFKRRTLHVPNLIPMTIKFDCLFRRSNFTCAERNSWLKEISLLLKIGK